MSTAMKVGVFCLAVFGLIMGFLMILGILHWLVLAAVILGICFVAYKAVTFGRKPIGVEHKALANDLKSFESSLDAHKWALDLEKISSKAAKKKPF